MRLRITHETMYRYAAPATYAIQTLKLMPRGSNQQSVEDWRIDVSRDCRLSPVEDPFGNFTHSFSIDGPIHELRIVATGTVQTEDTHGMVSGAPERMPLVLFLRDTDLTRPSVEIRDFAQETRDRHGGEPLSVAHGLMARIAETVAYEKDATEPTTSAAEVFKAGRGVCQDLAHVFIACARALEMPARYVGGYLWREDGANEQEAGHAWAEVHLGPVLGWIGFDPANDLCPTAAYVRVATGLDYYDAAPIRGTRYGGSGEEMLVKVQVEKLG